MLYRPNFCCQCGEKIARARWTLLTSRRFCEFCEIEQKQHDLLPRVISVFAFLIGAAGLLSYASGDGTANAESSPAEPSQVRKIRSEPQRKSDVLSSNGVNANRGNPAQAPSPNEGPPITVQRESQPNTSTEAVYYCGAITKKGTACTRRVRMKGRCWQHVGRPALLEERN